MTTSLLLLAAGLALIIFGSDFLVDGASAIARRSGLSEFVIGLTIVGMGTSAPEMVVSFIGAMEGNPSIALGNVVGSNIFNTLLILGVTALLLPICITRENRRIDIPITIGATFIVLLCGLKHTVFHIGTDVLNAWDGGLLLLLFAGYLLYRFRQAPKDSADPDTAAPEKTMALWMAILSVLGGLGGLIYGGRLFVNSSLQIAHHIGVSDKFIAITLLAGGTSFPELATCIVAAYKKKGQLALGNILGSNLFNLLLILGGAALIHPLSFSSLSPVDGIALGVSALAPALALVIGKKNQMDRWDGALFLLLWLSYMTCLFLNF